MDDFYKNIFEFNPNKKRKTWSFFYNLIVDMLSNEKLNPIVTELFIRSRKLNISLVFITQSDFGEAKKYKTTFDTLFFYENSKQMRASANCI